VNLLIDELPVALEVDGREYEIRSDFRTCLRIILAFEDGELSLLEKSMILLNDLYREVPENADEAIKQAVAFLNGGEAFQTGGGEQLRLYSFSKDAPLIYSAFRQTHGVDLEREDLHWWKFIALFMDLSGDTAFGNLINLRRRIKTGKATKEERQAAREIGDLLEVPEVDMRTIEEREAEEAFMQRVRKAKNGSV